MLKFEIIGSDFTQSITFGRDLRYVMNQLEATLRLLEIVWAIIHCEAGSAKLNEMSVNESNGLAPTLTAQ